MASRRPRSVFWVVSTHVATTALITALGVIGAGLLSAMLQFFPWLSIPLALGAPIAILAWQTQSSLGYVRRVAVVKQPTSCFMPSMLTFCSLAFVPTALTVFRSVNNHDFDFADMAFLFLYTVAMCVVFGLLTRRGFRKMEADQQLGFPVIMSGSIASGAPLDFGPSRFGKTPLDMESLDLPPHATSTNTEIPPARNDGLS